MDFSYPQRPALQVDSIEFDLDDNFCDIDSDNCLEEWAIDSDEIGNLVICRNALADNLRTDWD